MNVNESVRAILNPDNGRLAIDGGLGKNSPLRFMFKSQSFKALVSTAMVSAILMTSAPAYANEIRATSLVNPPIGVLFHEGVNAPQPSYYPDNSKFKLDFEYVGEINLNRHSIDAVQIGLTSSIQDLEWNDLDMSDYQDLKEQMQDASDYIEMKSTPLNMTGQDINTAFNHISKVIYDQIDKETARAGIKDPTSTDFTGMPSDVKEFEKYEDQAKELLKIKAKIIANNVEYELNDNDLALLSGLQKVLKEKTGEDETIHEIILSEVEGVSFNHMNLTKLQKIIGESSQNRIAQAKLDVVNQIFKNTGVRYGMDTETVASLLDMEITIHEYTHAQDFNMDVTGLKSDKDFDRRIKAEAFADLAGIPMAAAIYAQKNNGDSKVYANALIDQMIAFRASTYEYEDDNHIGAAESVLYWAQHRSELEDQTRSIRDTLPNNINNLSFKHYLAPNIMDIYKKHFESDDYQNNYLTKQGEDLGVANINTRMALIETLDNLDYNILDVSHIMSVKPIMDSNMEMDY